MGDKNKTTIQITNDTKKLLTDFGWKGETYNEIIIRLFKELKK